MTTTRGATRIRFDAGTNFVQSGLSKHGPVLVGNNEIVIPVGEASDALTVDARGCVVLPGFVDQHIHGVGSNRFWGLDGEQDYAESVAKAAEALPRYGVTSFVPTSVTVADGNYDLLAGVNRVVRRQRPYSSARILGSHAEGPFIHPQFRGAHTEAGLRKITRDSIHRLLEAAGPALLIVTLAPSLRGSGQAISIFRNRDIVVQLGHDMPLPRDVDRAVLLGATGVTHLFNGMGGINHRNDDFVAEALANSGLMFELIVHGGFVSHSWLRHALLSAPERAIAISDGVGSLADKAEFIGTKVMASTNCHVRESDNAVWAATGTLSDAVVVLRDLGMPWPIIADAVSRNCTKYLSKVSGRVQHHSGDVVVWRDDIGVVCTLIDGFLAFSADQRVVS